MRRPWTDGVLAGAAVAAIIVHVIAAVHPFDDAYIIFRYVQNTLGGQGAVYNAGEPVFGMSCPLYFIWLTALGAALPSAGLPELAARSNVIFLIAAGWLAFRLTRGAGAAPGAAAAAGAAVMIGEPALRASIGAMESPLFLALSFGALLMTGEGRDTPAVLLASLAALTRPEGALLVIVCLAAGMGPGGRGRWRCLAGLTPLAVWAVWSVTVYGSPIPHSVVAKAQPLYPLPAGAALNRLLTSFGHWTLDGVLLIPFELPLSGRVPRLGYQIAGILLTAWALWRWGRLSRGAGSARRLALPVWFTLLAIFYTLTNPLILPWYLPLAYAPWLTLVLGQPAAPVKEAPRARIPGMAARWLAAATVAVSFLFHLLPSDRSLLRHGASGARHAGQLEAYERAARWIGDRSEEADVVAAAEIGIVGYTLPRKILDACGLVSPEALPWLPPPPEERGFQLGPIPTGLIRAERPGWVMLLPAFGERSLLADAWFLSAYDLVHEEPFLRDDPRYRAVLIYRRRE